MLKKILIVIFSALILCGCTKTSKEEIVFSSWGSITETTILKRVINNFEQENPDIKIKFLHIPQNYFQKIHLLFASNSAPDVIFINNHYLPIYEKHLEDLSSYSDQDNFYKQAIDGLSVNNKLLAIPRDISNLVFYVNTDLVNIQKNELSLEEIINLAQNISDKETFGLSHEEDIYWALPYLRYFGGGILDNNLNLIINSSESQKGLEFYNSLVKEYKISPSKSQAGSLTQAQMFLNGNIAFYLSGRWMYPIILEKAKFNWAIIPFPNGELPQLFDTSGWAISKNSKHKNAGLKFVKYLASKETSEYFTQTGLIVPARKETSSALNNSLHNEKLFIELINKTEKTPISKNYKKITDEINLKFLNN